LGGKENIVINYVLEAEPCPLNISPDLFHEYARQYLQCERTFLPNARNSPVPYFLLCRAIELEFKATHLESKSRLDIKDKYGHNLKKSYDDLPRDKQNLDAAEYATLKHASKIYGSKGFEYVLVGDVVTALTKFPELAVLKRIATKVIEDAPP
jgi:hypothetical protein